MSDKPEGWLHRAPRPLILWAGVICALLGALGFALFLYRVGGAVADAYERAAQTGNPVPDMGGGIGPLLIAVGSFIASLWPIIQSLSQRHRERMDQQARGTAPGRPFDSSPPPSNPATPPAAEPMPGGGLVNNEAIQ